jgi:hypothetical protein
MIMKCKKFETFILEETNQKLHEEDAKKKKNVIFWLVSKP